MVSRIGLMSHKHIHAMNTLESAAIAQKLLHIQIETALMLL